jgi:T1SS-143 domain-containing protein
MTGTPLENAMAITLSGSITTDESGGLQNFTATSGILGDSDDNDIAVAAINNIDDANDLPLAFESRLFTLLGAVTPMQTALSGYTGATGNTGTDLITITGSYLDLAFTDANGKALGDPNNANAGTDWSGLYTLDGRRIFLYTDSTNNNIVLGRIGAEGTTDAPEDDLADPNGTIVFSAYLEQTATGAKVWMAQFAPLQNPVTSNPDDVVDMTNHLWATASQDAAFDFAGVPSGQNKFLMFKAGSSDVGLVVTGMDPDKIVNGKDAGDTVNTSQGGGATTIGTNNQGVDPGEGMIFTFVSNPNPLYTVPGLTHGEAIVEDNIDFGELFGATGATFVIAQQTPPKASTARISAYTTDFEEKSDYFDGLLDTDDNLAYITSVTIRDGNGNIIAGLDGVTANTTVGNITVTFNLSNNNTDRTVTIAGFQSKYSIEYTTSELHNRVLIENIGNANPQLNSPFDIGGFHLPNIVAEPQQIGSAVNFEDDGPTALAALGAGLVRHDETAGNDTDADDLTGPLAVFATVATVSTDMTAAYARGSASVIDASGSSGGQDGLASTVYSLNVASAGVDSGLDTTEGNSILLTKEGALVVGRISGGTDNGEAAFAVAIDANTGVLSVVQYHSIKHPTGGASYDESLFIDNAALLAVATVTDGDGDTQAASVGIGARVAFQDDGPTASAVLAAGLVRHDETAGPDGDADDVASPLAVFATVATVSTDMTAAYAQGTASVIDSSASSGGQDGLASTVYSLNVASAGVDSGLDTTEGNSILLTKEGALVVGRISGGTDDGEAAFAVAIDASTGVLSVVQYHSIKHPTGGASYDESLAIDNAALLAVATVTDGDGDTDTASVGIGARVAFQDDGPTASGTPVTATVDEEGLPGGIAGGTNDVIGQDASASDSIASIFQSGVDNPLTYGLSTDTSNLLQTLTSKGEAVKYNVTGNTLTAYVDVGASDGYQAADREVFTFALTAATGAYVFTQLDQLDHPSLNGQTGDNTENDLVLQLGTILQATDADGDTVTAAAEKLVITVDDDSPVVTAKSNLVYPNSANPTPGGTGIFAYDIGADDRLGTYNNASSSDLSVSMTGVSVGANAFTPGSVNWVTENDTSAVFNIAFSYMSDPTQGTTTNATGTLTFNKVADTYTLSLTDEIESFSILRTSTAKGFTGYAIGGTTPINQQPPVSVANLADDFFVQFSGFAEAGGGTGANNIKAGGDNDFAPGDLFSAATSWVSVSGTAAGVAGDTIQQGEVMDLDFFTANPFGNTNLAPSATSNGIFIKFDGIGNEDLVLVLKLVDPDGSNNPITRAIIVDSQDIILKTPSTTNNNFHPIANPAAYGITLDQNDGAVILERNDYNFGTENYVIQGVQVLVSTEGVTGEGYNLNGNVGLSGASTGTKLAFGNEAGEGSKSNPVEAGEAGTWDSDVVKIVDMGFVTSSTPDARLTFNVTVTDFDGDSTAAQTLDVTIAGGKTFTGGAGVDTFSFKALDADTDVLLSATTSVISAGFASGVDKLDFTTAGSGANYSEVLTSVANLETFISDANAALNGTTSYYFGVVGGNGYLAQDGDGVGITNIIQLVGVTNMASTDIV